MSDVIYTIREMYKEKSIYWTEMSDRVYDDFLPSTVMIAKREIDRRINKTLKMSPPNDFSSDSLGNITILPPIYSLYRQYILSSYMSDDENIDRSTRIREINEFIMYRANIDNAEMEVLEILERDYNGDRLTDKLVVCEKSLSELVMKSEYIQYLFCKNKRMKATV